MALHQTLCATPWAPIPFWPHLLWPLSTAFSATTPASRLCLEKPGIALSGPWTSCPSAWSSLSDVSLYFIPHFSGLQLEVNLSEWSFLITWYETATPCPPWCSTPLALFMLFQGITHYLTFLIFIVFSSQNVNFMIAETVFVVFYLQYLEVLEYIRCMLRFEWCPPYRCWSPYPQYLWTWPHLEIGSFQMLKLREGH